MDVRENVGTQGNIGHQNNNDRENGIIPILDHRSEERQFIHPNTQTISRTLTMAQKYTYTDQQLELYLNRIGYSHPAQSESNLLQHLRQHIENDALSALSDLQRRHLAAIPWGNSGLHYSQYHTISLNPQNLFEKMVERRLDGYCMENTGIFFIVLRSLGYLVYATGGRVSHAASKGLDNGLYLPL